MRRRRLTSVVADDELQTLDILAKGIAGFAREFQVGREAMSRCFDVGGLVARALVRGRIISDGSASHSYQGGLKNCE